VLAVGIAVAGVALARIAISGFAPDGSVAAGPVAAYGAGVLLTFLAGWLRPGRPAWLPVVIGEPFPSPPHRPTYAEREING
jgi:hypothetical protein